MFKILHVETFHGRGGSPFIRIAKDGLAAIKKREELGLPPSHEGLVAFQLDGTGFTDRRAAESWPEALDSRADLPAVVNSHHGEDVPENELQSMIRAGVLTFAGPVKLSNGMGESVVGITLMLSCSPFELVCWRRAWRAEQEASDAERRVKELEDQLEEVETE